MDKRNVFPWGNPSSYNLNWVNAPRFKLQKELSNEAKRRLSWMDYYFSHSKNASLACRYFGISRKTFYKWLNRYERDDLSIRRVYPGLQWAKEKENHRTKK